MVAPNFNRTPTANIRLMRTRMHPGSSFSILAEWVDA